MSTDVDALRPGCATNEFTGHLNIQLILCSQTPLQDLLRSTDTDEVQ